MTVTVAIPFRGDPRDLARCVQSVLKQTHRDLRVLVIADGQAARLRTRDSRVDVHRLPENRGCYYARAVALAATDTEWTAVVDSDDWVDRTWLADLRETGGDVVLHTTRTDHGPGKTTVRAWPRAAAGPAPVLVHTTSHVGLYRTQRLRDVGGYNPAYRIGWDTLVVGLLRLTGPITTIPGETYHRSVHDGQLTSHPETAIGTSRRIRVRRQLRAIYSTARVHRANPAKLRELIQGTIPEELAAEVAEHAARIRGSAAA